MVLTITEVTKMKTYLFALLLLQACGNNPEGPGSSPELTVPQLEPPAAEAAKVDEPSRHSLAIATTASLPACDDKGEGWLVYIKADNKFQVCASGKWEDLIQPEEKPVSSIAFQLLCRGTGDLDDREDVTVTGTSAMVVQFSSGDYFLTCNDSTADSYFTYMNDSAGSFFYAADGTHVATGNLTCFGGAAQIRYNIEDKAVYWGNLKTTPTIKGDCPKIK